MGEGPTNAIRILITELLTADAFNRRASAQMLGGYGKAAEEAVPALVQMLNDSDDTVRTAALRALKEIDPKTAAQREQHP